MILRGSLNKKFIYGFITVTLIMFLIISKTSFSRGLKKVALNIAGKNYTLLTASTPSERHKGLSGISVLKDADGMIFYFNPPKQAIFWNKDTHLSLELIWFNKGKVVGRDYLPSEDKAGLISRESPEVVDAVVELVR